MIVVDLVMPKRGSWHNPGAFLAQTIYQFCNLMILDKFNAGAGRGVEPYPVLETRKLLILESTEPLKSPEPTSSGTDWAQKRSAEN